MYLKLFIESRDKNEEEKFTLFNAPFQIFTYSCLFLVKQMEGGLLKKIINNSVATLLFTFITYLFLLYLEVRSWGLYLFYDFLYETFIMQLIIK